MSRRIFTKVFSQMVSLTGVAPTSEPADLSWLVQEDIEVIGASISIQNQTPSENDGNAFCEVELSQVGIRSQDGAILAGKAEEWWNTAPAGIAITNCNVAVTFPQGFAIPVKEEGYLYINGYGSGKTAGTSVFLYKVMVYYTKKSVR
ncbi:unnamed protein product [marine sediment metagenome]|uniref:Uncharacterized protein n=1 Tax=marine sediment metagenome TaxID=412755 RepID=X1JMM7_9ZZZZ